MLITHECSEYNRIGTVAARDAVGTEFDDLAMASDRDIGFRIDLRRIFLNGNQIFLSMLFKQPIDLI